MTIKPADRGVQIIFTYTIVLALATVVVAARVYCRAFVVRSIGLDDWFAIFAWVSMVFFSSFAITGAFHGTGQHFNKIVPFSEFPIAMKWWWACEPVYVVTNMALKASIATMLLRLTVIRIQRIIIWVTISVIEVYSLFFFFIFVLQCRPSSYFWTKFTGGKGTCIPDQTGVDTAYGYSAVSCVGDWILAILPAFMVWKLQMKTSLKFSLAGILGIGVIASIATIVRLPYIATMKDQADFLWATSNVAIWSMLETGLGLTACSLATLRPLFRELSSKSKYSGNSSGQKQRIPSPRPSDVKPKGINYNRSSTKTNEQYVLRDDIGPHKGVDTVVRSGQIDLERGESESVTSSERKLTVNEWSGDEGSAEEAGIRVTTNCKQSSAKF